MPQVSYNKASEKEIRKLPKSEQKKILRKIELLSESPFLGKPLMGELQGYYSLRAWPYRIIYTFNKTKGFTVHSVTQK